MTRRGCSLWPLPSDKGREFHLLRESSELLYLQSPNQWQENSKLHLIGSNWTALQPLGKTAETNLLGFQALETLNSKY